MLKNFVKIFGVDPNKKVIEQYSGIAREINTLEPEFEALSDEALRAKTDELRARIAESLGNVEGLEEKELFKLLCLSWVQPGAGRESSVSMSSRMSS